METSIAVFRGKEIKRTNEAYSKTFRHKGLLNALAVAEMQNGIKQGIR